MGGRLAFGLGVALLAASCASPAGEEAPSPIGSSSPTAVTSAKPTAQTSSPSAKVACTAVAVDCWVRVVVSGLNIREQPGTGAASIGLLPEGAEGMIAAGPVSADGYDWYALAGEGIPYASGCPIGPLPDGTLTCPFWFGWVASTSTAGETWLQPVAPDCPPVPETIDELAYLSPGRRLACYGGRPFEFRAYHSPIGAGRGCGPPIDFTPPWFDDCFAVFLQATATEIGGQGPEIGAFLHPVVGQCDFGGRSPDTCPLVPYIGTWIAVDGQIDHAAARTCEPNPQAEVRLYDEVHAVYECRTRFVITSVRPG
jgi:hypothetical protein